VIAEQRELRRETRMSARRARREAYHRDLESPVRYAVRSRLADRTVYLVAGRDQLEDHQGQGVGSRVMGTHETLAHARRRLGWL
jgi:GNAT superfamily N-acetyltransferase